MGEKNRNTHAYKSESYNIGRPDYPEAFFDYVYNEIGLRSGGVIADIGAGTGKITKKFLERGNKVFAVEPDNAMMRILKANTAKFTKCSLLENKAESTGILSNSVDFIFCGNSYIWFNRNDVIPEFKRIARDAKAQNIMIARLGPGDDIYDDKLIEINKKFSKLVLSREPNTSPPFKDNLYTDKLFEYVIYQSFEEFLHGCLSASDAPGPEDDCFDKYNSALKGLFDKYSIDGKLAGNFKLFCMMGSVDNLAY